MQVSQTIPILRIFDVAKAREFYLDYLGEHYGDGSPGAAVFFRMTGLHAFHQELAAKNYAYLRPGVERAPWNADFMPLTDPFGNRLRFNEYLK